MRNFIRMAAVAAAIAVLPVSCDNNKDNDGGTNQAAAPVISLVGGDIDATHEIVPEMSVAVNVKAEGAVKAFGIKIESPVLTEEVLGEFGLSTEMDLVNPASEAMATTLKGFGFPVGAEVEGKTEVTFDISELVPLIALLHDKASDHNFVLTVSDKKSQTTSKTLKFHLSGINSAVYNNDADLWANTATLTIKMGELVNKVTVEYKKSTAADWQEATVTVNADGTYKASITPAWIASGDARFTLNQATGIFAGNTYDYRVLADDQLLEGVKGSFVAAVGQTIPGGDMETWSKYNGYSLEETAADVYYPNTDKQSAFWSSGNNSMTQGLCLPDTLANNTYTAKLKGGGFSTIFAAGNLFAGVFDMDGFAGYARFGRKYTFTARPTAVKLRYKAVISKINLMNPDPNFPVPEHIKKGEVDPARIFVCITNWSDRHSVHSGLGVTVDMVNPLNPEAATTAEGPIIAVASKTITETVGEWTEVIIPIIFNNKEAKPAADNYSLVISAAASAYGDYLCGCRENELYIDDIEWVY